MGVIGTSPTDRQPAAGRQGAGSRGARKRRGGTAPPAATAVARRLAGARAALAAACLLAAAPLPAPAQQLAAEQLRFAENASPLALPPAALSRTESDFVRRRPVMRVAVPKQSFPPYQNVADGQVDGYSIRFLQTVAAAVGLELELRTYESWSDVLLALRRREADVIPVAAITPERRRYLAFTDGVVPAPAGLVGRQGDERFERDPQLGGYRVGVIAGFAAEEHLPIQFPEAVPVPLEPSSDPVARLLDGEIDFYYGPLHIVFAEDSSSAAAAVELKQRVFFGSGWNHIAVRSDWPALAGMFNRLIGNGRTALAPLIADFFDERVVAALPPLELSAAELAFRASLTALRVGAVRGGPLFNDLDAEGRHIGIASELTSFASYQIGLPVEVTAFDTVEAMLEGLRVDAIDLIPYFAISEERRRNLAFSRPYLEMPWVLMGRTDGTLFWDVESLEGRTLAIRHRHPLLPHIREDHPEIELLLTANAAEAVEAVVEGRAEATIETKLYVNRAINERPAGLLRAIDELEDAPGRFAFAALKSDATLISVIDKALADLDEALIDRIVRRWVTVDFEPLLELRRTLGLVVPALALSLLFLLALALWIRRVRRDNVRRRQAEQRLLDMTDRLQSGVFQFRHYRGKPIRLVFANRFARRVAKMRTDEYGEEHIDFLEHVAEDEREAFAARLRHCLSTGETFRETIRYKFPDGTKGWVLADANCREEPDGARVWNGYLFDLTGERHLNEELNAAMLARDEFISMASHELRTPIQNVVSALELVDTKEAALRERYVDNARAAAADLELLIGDLVELSTLNHHELTLSVERFDIAEQVREVCRTFESTAREKGLALRVDIDEGVPARHTGDRLRCRQILYNIVGNALKYTDAGAVHVELRRAEEAGNGADAAGGEAIEIAVSDTGIGIPASQLARVFEPFATIGHPSRSSSGLGLALCDRLAASMGGRIDVTSEEGRGSRFTLTLPPRTEPPATASVEEDGARRGSAAPAWNLDSDTVLVVDDNLVVREMLVQLLEQDGWRTRQAADGASALEIARREPLIAIVSDQQMPGMTGTALARRLLDEHVDGEPRPVLIMISGGMSRGDAAEAGGSFDAMLFKPVKVAQIRRAIASVTGGERVAREPREGAAARRPDESAGRAGVPTTAEALPR